MEGRQLRILHVAAIGLPSDSSELCICPCHPAQQCSSGSHQLPSLTSGHGTHRHLRCRAIAHLPVVFIQLLIKRERLQSGQRTAAGHHTPAAARPPCRRRRHGRLCNRVCCRCCRRFSVNICNCLGCCLLMRGLRRGRASRRRGLEAGQAVVAAGGICRCRGFERCALCHVTVTSLHGMPSMGMAGRRGSSPWQCQMALVLALACSNGARACLKHSAWRDVARAVTVSAHACYHSTAQRGTHTALRSLQSCEQRFHVTT